MEIDLRQVFTVVRKWAWLLILVTLLAGASAFVTSSRQTAMYSASATLLVNPGQSTGSTDLSALQAGRGLAETYRLLIGTGPVLDRVVGALDLPYGPDTLGTKVTSSAVRDTQLVKVTVIDPSPEQATLIANTLAEEFKEYVREQTRSRMESSLAGLDEQIAKLEARSASIDERVVALDTAENSDNASVQRELDSLTQERARVNQSLADAELAALNINTEIATNTTHVEVADPARVPSQPYAPRVAFTTLLGLFLGLLIGAGLVALLEFLDNTVKASHDLQELTGSPVLATVAELPKLPTGGGQVYTIARPRANATEAIRLLRTNLDFAAASKPIASLTITSAVPGEGKSTVTANLGVVMAQAGHRTVIIDADLRKPTQHRIFGVNNAVGLTTLLMHPEQHWEDAADRVALPGLSLIPSGPLPPNPSDLLSSDRFAELIERIQLDVDFVIIDSAPVMAVSDALAVAPRSDGLVLVTRPNHTKVDELRMAVQSIHQGDIRLIGVVLNRLRKQHTTYYYGEYFAADESAAPQVGRSEPSRRVLPRLKRLPGSVWQGM